MNLCLKLFVLEVIDLNFIVISTFLDLSLLMSRIKFADCL